MKKKKTKVKRIRSYRKSKTREGIGRKEKTAKN